MFAATCSDFASEDFNKKVLMDGGFQNLNQKGTNRFKITVTNGGELSAFGLRSFGEIEANGASFVEIVGSKVEGSL